MNLIKKFKTCLVLFITALLAALLSFGGAILLALSKSYPPALVLAAVSFISFYCAPFYYRSAADYRAFSRILDVLDESNTLEELAKKSGIRADAVEKLYRKASSKGIIRGYEEKDGKISKI